MSESIQTPERSDVTTDEDQMEPATFKLMVVSPSAGVSGPLNFPQLSVTTSVKGLKAKIRDVLPSKPADGSQRLIHRGRMLGVESETMLEIFGREAIRTSESQTLHLVLRPVEGLSTSPSPSLPTQVPQPLAAHSNPLLFQPPRPASTPALPIQGMPAQLPLPGFSHLQQRQLLHQYEHAQNVMNQRLQHLQRETQHLHQEIANMELGQRMVTQSQPIASASPGMPNSHNMPALYQSTGLRAPQVVLPSVQMLINQQQRERAAEGRHGAQRSGNITPQGGPSRPTSSAGIGPISQRPEHTTTYTREGTGLNGERWHVTVNETTTTFPPQHTYPHSQPSHPSDTNPALDIQTALRNADRFMAAQGLRNNMQRIASNSSQAPTESSHAGQPFTNPFLTTPVPTSSPGPANTALPNSTSFGFATNANYPAVNSGAQTGSTILASAVVDPMVYILSSPQGPRALLIQNSGNYFTPRPRRHQFPVPSAISMPAAAEGQPRGLPQAWENMEQRAARRAHRQRRANNPLEPVNGAHANPGAGALAAQLAPYLWLIIRLIGFVWFFSMGNPSWTRFLMVTGLAFCVFLYNTGLFGGVAEDLWAPVRRHLEALIPLAGPDAPAAIPAVEVARIPEQPAAQRAANAAIPRRRRGELEPAEVAAHLLGQHRQATVERFMAHLRRIEHSFLLLLASLVPGVGERHIAAREAEDAARQRRIEAAAASENQDGGNPEEAGEGAEPNGRPDENQEHDPLLGDPPNGPVDAQPLVQV